jgi:hypothetical protein
MTFVCSTDERAVLTGLGLDPDDAVPPTDPEFSSTLGITIIGPVTGWWRWRTVPGRGEGA